VPLVLKIAPDLDTAGIRTIAEAVRRYGIDGVIAANTSVSREGVEKLPHANEAGGLSGAPIRGRATRVLKELCSLLPQTTLIGAGGFFAARMRKRPAGAALVSSTPAPSTAARIAGRRISIPRAAKWILIT
jgi:dihydroorotate dehydrogenase